MHCTILQSIGGPNVWQENDERCSRVQRAEGCQEQSSAGFTKSGSNTLYEGRCSDTIDQLNPVCYVALYFGHKLHIDQNEKLIMFGETHVIARDGYSGKIVGFITMPIKNNLDIYESVFRYNAILIHMQYIYSLCGPWKGVLPGTLYPRVPKANVALGTSILMCNHLQKRYYIIF